MISLLASIAAVMSASTQDQPPDYYSYMGTNYCVVEQAHGMELGKVPRMFEWSSPPKTFTMKYGACTKNPKNTNIKNLCNTIDAPLVTLKTKDDLWMFEAKGNRVSYGLLSPTVGSREMLVLLGRGRVSVTSYSTIKGSDRLAIFTLEAQCIKPDQ